MQPSANSTIASSLRDHAAVRGQRPPRPVLLLEINEVPWRLVDKAVRDPYFVNIRRFFNSAATFTTIARDIGELSPWVTWPSLHRGISNREHGIKNLGQDVATFRGKPIWQEYRDRNLSIGVCGSLQSWPPIDPGPGGFFIPDTFAHDEQCIPRHIEPLQKFNLGQVRKNGRVVRGDLGIIKDSIRAVPAALRAKITPRTCAKIVRQVVLERFDKTRVARRPIFQTMLYWDVFKGLYAKKNQQLPLFATFFTNHVAGVMHRYWDDVFPEDFADRKNAKARPLHADTMDFALTLLDDMIGDALALQAANPELAIVFASSMGQAAVHRDHEGFDCAISDVAAFMRAFDVKDDEYKPLLAMVPQIAVEMINDATRREVKSAIGRATSDSGRALFRVEEIGKSLSITIMTPRKIDIESDSFKKGDDARSRIDWKNAGIAIYEVDAGTAYHVPEGVLAIVGARVAPSRARTSIEATDVKGRLMDLAGLGT